MGYAVLNLHREVCLEAIASGTQQGTVLFFWCSGRREIANKKRGFLGISSFELPVLETV